MLTLKDKILEEDWKAATNEWRTTLSRLDECFAVLFPRLDIGVNIDQSSAANKSSLVKDSANSTSVMSTAATMSAVEEFNDVAWVNADDEGDEEGHESEDEDYKVDDTNDENNDITNNIGGVPYTLVRYVFFPCFEFCVCVSIIL